MHTTPISLVVRLFSAFILGAVTCHLIYHDSGDSKATVDNQASRISGEDTNHQIEQTPASHDKIALLPIPDPGPGTKGFDPWANSDPIEVAVKCKGTVNCDGSVCGTSVAQRQMIPTGENQSHTVTNAGPTLAFPTVMPSPPRGHLIEVDVEFPNQSDQQPDRAGGKY